MTTSDWNAPRVLSMGPFGLHCLPATYSSGVDRKKREGGKKEPVVALLSWWRDILRVCGF